MSQPTWSIQASNGPDSGATASFAAGLGVAFWAFALVFAALVVWALLRRLLAIIGYGAGGSGGY